MFKLQSLVDLNSKIISDPVYGKQANRLLDLAHLSIPIANSFIITPQAFNLFASTDNLSQKILLNLRNADHHDPHNLEQTAKIIKKLIKHQEFNSELAQLLHQKYTSSIAAGFFTITPSPSATQQASLEKINSFLKGDVVLLNQLRAMWMAQFTPYSIKNWHSHSHLPIISVIISSRKPSQISGTAFSINPLHQSKSQMLISAIRGEQTTSDMVPDQYLLNKSNYTLISQSLVRQDHYHTFNHHGKKVNKIVPKKLRSLPKLSLRSLKIISKHTLNLHHKHLMPVELNFRVEDQELVFEDFKFIDNMPILKNPAPEKSSTTSSNLKLISKGLPSSPGLVSAPARVLKSNNTNHKAKPGEIIITSHASAHVIPHFKHASGIVTELGGPTSHAAIIAREIGCPAITSALKITSKVKTGDIITVNGSTGEVFKGGLPHISSLDSVYTPAQPQASSSDIRTATKVLMSVSDAKSIKLASGDFDGVGLIRGDILLANFGFHPKHILSSKMKDEYLEYLSSTISSIANTNPNHPAIYWPSNLYSNHYRQLKGSARHEPDELNPMLGYHGAARIISDPAFFELELKTIFNLRHDHHFQNIHITLPFVRSRSELIKIKKIIAGAGLSRHSNFKIYLNLETPASIFNLKSLIEQGIDGIIINSNILTTLTTGYDPNNHEVNQFYNSSDTAVLQLVKMAALTAHEAKLSCLLHGQILSTDADIYKKVVSWGIDGVIVNPNQVLFARNQLSKQELYRVSQNE